MKEYRLDDNRAIRFVYGNYVELDVAPECEVEFEYCRANDLLYIREKSWYSEKLSRCENIGAIKERLKLLPHAINTNGEQSTQGGSTKRANTKPNSKQDIALENAFSELDELVAEADEINEDADEAVVFDSNGNNDKERSRNAEGIRRSYNNIRRKVESTARASKSVFETVALDTNPSFTEMSKHAADYARYIARKYGNFKAGFMFLEPCENGSWHVHIIITFSNDVPATFEEDAKKWWSKRNKKPSEFQVDVREIIDLLDLERTLDYLNPLSSRTAKDTDDDEKTTKRERLHFYQLWCKPMRCFGDVVDSVKGLAKMKDLEKLGLEELEEKRRKYAEIYDVETGDILYTRTEFLFVVSEQIADGKPDTYNSVKDKPPKPPKPKICGCFDCIADDCPNVLNCSSDCKNYNSCFDCLGAMYDNLCPYSWHTKTNVN